VRPSDRASRVRWAGALQAGLDTLWIFARDRGLGAYGPLAPRARRPVRMIVSGDDLGMSPGVNQGLLGGLACGALTSVSVLTNGAALAAGVAALRGQDADAGLHLDLLEGDCVLHLCLARRTSASARLAGQLAVLRGHGIEPTHVDAHRHAWCLPWDRRTLLRRMRGVGIGAVRSLRPLGSPWSAGWADGVKRLILLGCATLSAGLARGYGLAEPDGWIDAAEAARWVREGRAPGWARGRIVEVIAHPALGASDVPTDERGTLDRAAETRAVFEPPLARALAGIGVHITNFREVRAARRG
jgi:predicted glycoside hydrolase/deacetylase ChbG (UPF0249 family)